MKVKLLLCGWDRSIQPGKRKAYSTLKKKKKQSKPRRKQGNTKTALPLMMGMAVSSLTRQISHNWGPSFWLRCLYGSSWDCLGQNELVSYNHIETGLAACVEVARKKSERWLCGRSKTDPGQGLLARHWCSLLMVQVNLRQQTCCTRGAVNTSWWETSPNMHHVNSCYNGLWVSNSFPQSLPSLMFGVEQAW